MADLRPSRPDISDDDKDPRVVGLDSDDVDDLLAAISSETETLPPKGTTQRSMMTCMRNLLGILESCRQPASQSSGTNV